MRHHPSSARSRSFRYVAGFAFAAAFAGSGAAAKADEKIRILCPTWVGYAPVLVAKDLGYFKEAGIEVELRFEDDRTNVLAAMTKGEIEVDMRTVGEHQGRPREETTPGIIIGVIDESLGGDGVIADGSVDKPADLKGKTVAVEPNIPARLILQMELKKVGLSLKDVKVKDIATADTVAVFADPSVAAVASYEPFLSQAVKNLPDRKPHILASSKTYPGLIIDVITARQDDLKANPAKYEKFLAGIYKAVDYFDKEPEKFIKLAAPHYKLTEDEAKDTIASALKFTTLADAKTYLGKPGAPGKLYEIFDTVMGLNLENGAADKKLSAAQQIDSSVVAKLP
jgi:NitT/TauT family transport system substrate-binding protein